MAYKRQTDRLPIPPADAKVQTVSCHYCIVGCGYKAYSWPATKQGGTAASENAFGIDLGKQQDANADGWFAPSMYNMVKQDGKDRHLVIKPDVNCVVNSGLGSIRGGRMAENQYSTARGTQLQRLTDPLVWRYGTWQPTGWDDALDLVARVTAQVITDKGEDELVVSMFDHGGSAGGYENTWGTGKLYFDSMKIKNVRIHNRPAYNSEVHATRDMGVGELNNAYEDAELADTLVAVGCNPLETQSNYFLNHWIPNLRGTSLDKKKKMIPGEEHAPAKIIFIDPRRTVSVAAAEAEAGKENVLHLALNSGTDLLLLNAIFTYIADKGWVDSEFIANSTIKKAVARPALYPARGVADSNPGHLTNFKAAVEGCRVSVEEAAKITGLAAADIVKAAEWIAKPKAGGKRRRVMTGYEKGIIWGNDNYRTNGALVNISLATGNVGRLGGGCVRLGGHQEGYVRPSDAHVGRPATYVDQLLMSGKGGVHHIWACDHYKTTLNASKFKRIHKQRADKVKDAIDAAAGGTRDELVSAIVSAIREGGLFVVNMDIKHSQIGQNAHVILPGAQAGEMHLTSMNGERRMRITEKYMDPPGSSRPDCLIAAGIAQNMERVLREMGKDNYADQFKGYDWKTEEDAFEDGYRKNAGGGEFVTYDRLRAMGTNGFQEPATGLKGETIIGTSRLYTDGVFSSENGKAKFIDAPWRGLQAKGKQQQKDRYPFLINNGRTNLAWQNMFLDEDNEFVMDRAPYPAIEMHPDDMAKLGVKAGDLVEVYNNVGATQAMAYPTPSAKKGETFMQFGHPKGAHGNVVNAGVNELILPNYKQTWASIRKLADAPATVKHLTFKSKEYMA